MLKISRPMALAVGLSIAIAGCGDSTLTIASGVRLDLSASDLIQPGSAAETALRDSTTNPDSIRIISCTGTGAGTCVSSVDLPVSCVMSECDPDPVTISEIVAEVDFHDIAMDVASHVDEVELLALDYQILSNTLTVGVGALEVFWGPAGAVTVDPAMGVRPLGVIPAISAGMTGEGEMILDDAGNQALTDYLRDMSMQVRFFVRTTTDLDPGGNWPAGDLESVLTMTVRVTGGII